MESRQQKHVHQHRHFHALHVTARRDLHVNLGDSYANPPHHCKSVDNATAALDAATLAPEEARWRSNSWLGLGLICLEVQNMPRLRSAPREQPVPPPGRSPNCGALGPSLPRLSA